MSLLSQLPLLLALQFGFRPLSPAWSPDHLILATTRAPQRFVTPEGADYTLLLNGRVVYPIRKKHHWLSTYENQHTFLSELVWSPDSSCIAFVEKVYGWEYADPFNSDFEGWATDKRFYLTVVSRTKQVIRYGIDHVQLPVALSWQDPDRIDLNGRIFDLRTDSPQDRITEKEKVNGGGERQAHSPLNPPIFE